MTKHILTFIVPVRYQDNAKDWSRLVENLVQTVGSIANQDTEGWRGIVVANFGAELPECRKISM